MKKIRLFDMFRAENEQEKKAAQERKAQKAKNKMRTIPQIALIMANVLVVSLDYRVVDAVYSLTKSIPLAVFGIFVSGAMFIFWFDFLYQYKLASDWQGYISLAGSALSLITAGMFAVLDYRVHFQLSNSLNLEMPTSVNFMFGSMVWLTVIHAVLLFWWFMIDEQISGERTVEKQAAKRAAKQQNMERVAELLAGAEKLLMQKAALIEQYGAEEVEMTLSAIAGIEIDLTGDGVIGHPSTLPAPVGTMAQTVDAPAEIINSVDPTKANTPNPRP